MKYCFTSPLFFIFMLSCSKEKSFSKQESAYDHIPQFSVSARTFELSSKFLKREITYTNDNPLMKSVRLFSNGNAQR